MRPRSPEAFTEDLKETLIKLEDLAKEADKLDLTVCLAMPTIDYNRRLYLHEFKYLKINTVRQTTEYYKDTD